MNNIGLLALFQQGGPLMLMFPVLAILAIASSGICGVFALMGRRVPAVLWYFFPALIVIFAEVHTSIGLSFAHDGVSMSVEEYRATLAAQGYGLAMSSVGFGYLLFGLTMVWSSLWAAASCVRLMEPGGLWKPVRVVGISLVWLLGTGTALCTPIVAQMGMSGAALLMGLFLLTWVLLGLRDTEHPEERNRLMFARGLTVWMIAAGCLAFAFSAFGFGQSSVYTAIANAPPDQRMVMVAVNQTDMLGGIWTGIGGMVVALVTGLVAFGRHIRVGANSTDLIKAGFMLALIGIWALSFVTRVVLGSRMTELGL